MFPFSSRWSHLGHKRHKSISWWWVFIRRQTNDVKCLSSLWSKISSKVNNLDILYIFIFYFSAVSDNTRPAMSLDFRFSCDVNQNLKNGPGAFSPSLLSGPLRKQKVLVCDFWSIRFFVFQGSLLLNFRVRSRVFEKRIKFYLYSFIFTIFFYTEAWQVKIVPIELPEETQIWKGENELARSRQHLLSQLLLVMTAFIWQTQWMLQDNGLIDVAKNPKSWNVFDNVGRVLPETAIIDL